MLAQSSSFVIATAKVNKRKGSISTVGKYYGDIPVTYTLEIRWKMRIHMANKQNYRIHHCISKACPDAINKYHMKIQRSIT